jgi:hypothetical protein
MSFWRNGSHAHRESQHKRARTPARKSRRRPN